MCVCVFFGYKRWYLHGKTLRRAARLSNGQWLINYRLTLVNTGQDFHGDMYRWIAVSIIYPPSPLKRREGNFSIQNQGEMRLSIFEERIVSN